MIIVEDMEVLTGTDSTFTRFTPLEPFETPMAVDAICAGYRQALGNQVVDSFILIPIFICDFLCIHSMTAMDV